MDRTSPVKLYPLLYPFKKKPLLDISLLYPSERRPLVDTGQFKDITIGTIFSSVKVLNNIRMNQLETTNTMDWRLQTILINLARTPNMSIFLASGNGPTDIALERLKLTEISLERLKPTDISRARPKPTDISKKRPKPTKIFVEKLNPSKISLEWLKLTDISQKRPKSTEIYLKKSNSNEITLERLPPRDISQEMPESTLKSLKKPNSTEISQKSTDIFQERPNPEEKVLGNLNEISLERLTPRYISHERPKSLEKSNPTEISQKPADLFQERSNPKGRVFEISNPTEISLDWLQPTDISQERPKPSLMAYTVNARVGSLLHTLVAPGSERFKTPIPEYVSLTRVDLGQARLDKVPLRLKVTMGIISGIIATTAVHPLDVIKVRLQLFPKKITTVAMLRRIMVCEGQRGLYAGLTAGILRQLTYTGSRLYVYNTLFEKHRKEHGEIPNFSSRLRIAVAAGLVGAFAGTPSEVALVRMIEVFRLRRSSCSPPCSVACRHVRHPESALPQLLRIARREGVTTWWRGGVPTLIRSVFVTTAQTGAYAEIHEAFERRGMFVGGVRLHVCTAICSSLISAVLSLPVDQVKTRYQSIQEKMNHVDILKDMLKKKGVKYLWKGFLPYYVRQAVHTMITYVTLDFFIDTYIEIKEASKR